MKRSMCVLVRGWAAVVMVLVLGGGTEPFVTSDLLRIRNVGAIDVADDGSVAVLAVRSIGRLPEPKGGEDGAASRPGQEGVAAAQGDNAQLPATADLREVTGRKQAWIQPRFANQTHLYLLDLRAAEGRVRQLTHGLRHDDDPQVSPDGKQVAFVRADESGAADIGGGDEAAQKPQIWVMPLDGGEARQVTRMEHGAFRPRWSPDGGALLFSSVIPLEELEGSPAWPMERPKRAWKDAEADGSVTARPDGTREEIRAWLELNAGESNPDVITRLEFQDEQSLRGPWTFNQLFMVDVREDASAEPMRLTSGFCDHDDAAFMPDGSGILYTAKKPGDKHYDRVLATSLWRMNVNGSDDQELLAVEGWTLNQPMPSRDGAVLAFLGTQMDEPVFRQTRIGLASIAADGAKTDAKDFVWLTDEKTCPTSVDDMAWSGAQPAVLFTTARQGGFPLLSLSPSLVEPAEVAASNEQGPIGVQAFSAGGGAVVYSVCCPTNPCVLRVRDGAGDRQVWDLNEWVAEKAISQPKGGWINRPDGTRVQYWLMQPAKVEAGRKHPLVLDMHGGPAAMWGPGEFSTWFEFQLLCSWGFGVVYANPRGSGGYGYEFQKGNFQNWGEGPGGDVLAAVDQALMNEWVDPQRLVITGGSYAGYLTVWVIEHDHRFKAAVAQRGVYDFATFYGEGNAWRLVAWAMGGNPYDPKFKQAIERNNVFTQVQRIQTPLLIKHASQDLRTGVSQSEMLYRALKDLGREVEYVRYPDEGHELSRSGDPVHRMDRLNRMIEFFERYVGTERAAPRATESAWEATGP